MSPAFVVLGICLGPVLSEPGSGSDKAGGLAGRWTLLSMSVAGKPAENEFIGGLQLQIAADGGYEMVARDSAVVRGKILKLDAKAKSPTIDWNIASRNEYSGKFWPVHEQKGIYRLDGDRLRMCFAIEANAKRPETFEAPKDARIALYEWKRAK